MGEAALAEVVALFEKPERQPYPAFRAQRRADCPRTRLKTHFPTIGHTTLLLHFHAPCALPHKRLAMFKTSGPGVLSAFLPNHHTACANLV